MAEKIRTGQTQCQIVYFYSPDGSSYCKSGFCDVIIQVQLHFFPIQTLWLSGSLSLFLSRCRKASRPDFCLQSSRTRVDRLSYESKPTEKRWQYDWRADKYLDGLTAILAKSSQLLLQEKNKETELMPRARDKQYQSKTTRPIFFPALLSYCSRLSVVLLSYDSRSTLIRLDRRQKFGRVATTRGISSLPAHCLLTAREKRACIKEVSCKESKVLLMI